MKKISKYGLLVLVLLLFAGCRGEDTAVPTMEAGVYNAVDGDSAMSSTAVKAPNACDLLSAAEIADALDVDDVAADNPVELWDETASNCTWARGEGVTAVTLGVWTNSASDAGQQLDTMIGAAKVDGISIIEPTDNLGDRGYLVGEDNSLSAMWQHGGTHFIILTVVYDATKDSISELAGLVDTRLSP